VLTWQHVSKSFIIVEDNDIKPKLSEGEEDTVFDKGIGVPLVPPSGRYDDHQVSIHYKVCVSLVVNQLPTP
jgi:hypothetical protein